MSEENWREKKRRLVQRYHQENQVVQKGQVVFVGSSLMEMFPVEMWTKELDFGYIVYNRGVGGYKTVDLLPILDICVFELEPCKVFINIGTNDLSDADCSIVQVMERYEEIIVQIEKHLPETKIYMMAYYPVNYEVATEQMKPCLRIRTNEKIACANLEVEKLAKRRGHRYIDVNALLRDAQGNLKAEYTIEGMHITPEGYRAIFPELMRYVLE